MSFTIPITDLFSCTYLMHIIYLIILISLLFFVVLLLRKLKLIKQKMILLHQEKEDILGNFNKKQKNPLGPLLVPNTKSMMIAIKKDGKIIDASDSLLELLNYTKKQLLGKNIYGSLIPAISKREPLEMNIINRIFQNPKLYTECETELSTKDGKKVWISWTNRLVNDKKGDPIELRAVGFDITKRKNLEEELQFMASKDPQTGVLNRLSLLENGTRELKRSIRYKHAFSVLALRLITPVDDLPALKVESLLKEVVSLCHRTIRDVDYFGRIGEAEFILLLPETEEENIPFLEKRLTEKILEYNKKNPSLPIQVSFGKSAYTPKTKSIDELISKALSNIKQRKVK